MKKICTKCKKEKEITDFRKQKTDKNGRRSDCLMCEKQYYKKYRENNKEKLKKEAKEYYQNNKEKLKEKTKKYRDNNKEYINKKNQEYNQNNKEYFKKKSKEYNQNNKEYIKKKNQEYYQNNKEYFKKRFNQYYKRRRNTDLIFRLTGNIRSNIYKLLKNKNYSKKSKTYKIIGLQQNKLYGWLNNEASNVSYARTEKQLLALNHYSNLQLLSADDNLKKRDSEPKFENLKRVFDHHPNKKILHSILFE
jgi:hypothetical protein